MLINISQEQASWRPEENRWTMLEIINHLYDIEQSDFRYEFDMILFHPQEEWPNFSIEKWRIDRKYNERDFNESIHNFMTERDSSIETLRNYEKPNLEARHSGNGFFGEPMSAGEVLISWIGHDLFHIRQISLLSEDILEKWSKSVSPSYECL